MFVCDDVPDDEVPFDDDLDMDELPVGAGDALEADARRVLPAACVSAMANMANFDAEDAAAFVAADVERDAENDPRAEDAIGDTADNATDGVAADQELGAAAWIAECAGDSVAGDFCGDEAVSLNVNLVDSMLTGFGRHIVEEYGSIAFHPLFRADDFDSDDESVVLSGKWTHSAEDIPSADRPLVGLSASAFRASNGDANDTQSELTAECQPASQTVGGVPTGDANLTADAPLDVACVVVPVEATGAVGIENDTSGDNPCAVELEPSDESAVATCSPESSLTISPVF